MTDDQFQLLYDGIQKQSEKLDTLHGDWREFKGSMEVRVKAVETQAKSDRMWGHLETVVVIPVVAAIHQLATHFGVIK